MRRKKAAARRRCSNCASSLDSIPTHLCEELEPAKELAPNETSGCSPPQTEEEPAPEAAEKYTEDSSPGVAPDCSADAGMNSFDDTSHEIVIVTPEETNDGSAVESSMPQKMESSMDDMDLQDGKEKIELASRSQNNRGNTNRQLDQSQNNVFVWCSYCPAVLLIRYPAQQQKLSFLNSSRSTTQPSSDIVATVCRSCSRKGHDITTTSSLPLATHRVQGMLVYQNACILACQTVNVATDDSELPLCVSMDQISATMTDDCSLLGLDPLSINEKRVDARDFFTPYVSSSFL